MRHSIGISIIALVCLLGGAACAPSASSTSTGGSHSTPTATLPTLGTLAATIPVTGSTGLSVYAADERGVWALDDKTGAVTRIDPQTNRVVATIAVGHLGRKEAGGIAIDQDAVWVANTDGTIARIDPRTNQMVATLTPPSVGALATSPGALWSGNFDSGTLTRYDAKTNRVSATIGNLAGPTAVSYGAGSVWVCNHHSEDKQIMRIDAQTNAVLAEINLGNLPGKDYAAQCGGVLAQDQATWVVLNDFARETATHVARVDPATNHIVATIQLPGTVEFLLAADTHGVWVHLEEGKAMLLIDPRTNSAIGQVSVDGIVTGFATGAGALWVSTDKGEVLRIRLPS